MSAVLVAIVTLVGGYYFGVLRSRNERRDAAIADIYKALMLFYRCLIGWAKNPAEPPKMPPGEEQTTWPDYCERLYADFTSVSYGNAIWLGRETDERVSEFAVKARIVLDAFSYMAPDGRLDIRYGERMAIEYLEAELQPLQKKIRGRLRDEMEWSLYLIPYRIVIGKKQVGGR